ncbi:hypothetical protein ACQV5M_17645 [Leptospira sp. SA-E8]|uniref:hypothetical protein n=1 Tax=Leptospira sp. SA-E8 TaxID=3422259 RepID=UPI003EBAE190
MIKQAKVFIFAGFILLKCNLLWENTYTLYRDSVLDSNARIHVATFDAEESGDYNKENCNLAKNLFLKQEGVKTNFWCEKGMYKK